MNNIYQLICQEKQISKLFSKKSMMYYKGIQGAVQITIMFCIIICVYKLSEPLKI